MRQSVLRTEMRDAEVIAAAARVLALDDNDGSLFLVVVVVHVVVWPRRYGTRLRRWHVVDSICT